jgi:hypothetical protein
MGPPYLRLSRTGDPTNSYATASIAFEASSSLNVGIPIHSTVTIHSVQILLSSRLLFKTVKIRTLENIILPVVL